MSGKCQGISECLECGHPYLTLTLPLPVRRHPSSNHLIMTQLLVEPVNPQLFDRIRTLYHIPGGGCRAHIAAQAYGVVLAALSLVGNWKIGIGVCVCAWDIGFAVDFHCILFRPSSSLLSTAVQYWRRQYVENFVVINCNCTYCTAVIYLLTETETEKEIISLTETKTETEMISKMEMKYKRK